MYRAEVWYGMGMEVQDAKTSKEVIDLADLNWKVKQKPAYIDVDGNKIDTGYTINYKDSDNSILGVVGKNYKVVQNEDAFAFTDELVGDGTHSVEYETAGELAGGKVVWMLARLPQVIVLDDEIDNYLLFSNSHDGTSAVRCCITPVRVICKNTLNLALRTAKRSWRYTHAGDLASKILDAKNTLIYADKYNKEFAKEAERLATKHLTHEDVERIVNVLIPPPKGENISNRKMNNYDYARTNFMKAFNEDDISNFRYTAYGIVNAIADFSQHTSPLRATDSYQERQLMSVINGDKLIDKAYKLVA